MDDLKSDCSAENEELEMALQYLKTNPFAYMKIAKPCLAYKTTSDKFK